jgi:MurNAc alpha-1-phosphate uridylyltransferase
MNTAMILAAGRGERMRPLTDLTPKPLLQVRGRPLIEHHVVALATGGFNEIVVNLCWLGEQIRDYLGDGTRYGVSIRYSEEYPRALGAAGGILRALPLLGDAPFAVVNGDIVCDFPYASLKLDAKADAHLVLVPNPPQHRQGDFGIDRGLAVPNAPNLFTFSGIALYRPAFFQGSVDGVLPLKPLLLHSMQMGRCSAELYTGVWEDVGTPQRLAAANAG